MGTTDKQKPYIKHDNQYLPNNKLCVTDVISNCME